jgi:hypothetical protein
MTAPPAFDALGRLPQFLRELLDSCPAAGDGLHFWQFRCARHLLAHFDERTTFELLKAAALNSGRPPRKLEIEIAAQIRSASARRWQPRNADRFKPAGSPAALEAALAHFVPAPSWPEPDENKIREIVNDGAELIDLIEHSPVRRSPPAVRHRRASRQSQRTTSSFLLRMAQVLPNSPCFVL